MGSFRDQLVEFARRGVARASQCHNEECTKLYLVLPFLQLLGYDPNDPDQVAAEHSADFSDKYKNRVDFLLKADGVAAIALECKPCGWDLKEDRGQLKSYFNALQEVSRTDWTMSSLSTALKRTVWTMSLFFRSA